MDFYEAQNKAIHTIITSARTAAGIVVKVIHLLLKITATVYAVLPILFMANAVENCIHAVTDPEKIEIAINYTIACGISTGFIVVLVICISFCSWIWSNK